MPTDVYLYDAVRTPFGKYGGALAGVRPDDLAAHVVRTLVDRAPALEPARVDEIVLGNANGAGEDNRNVARMAGLLAGLPTSVPATTVNRLCGSSLDAAIVASRQVALGEADVVVAGGVESMSRAPWVLPKPEKPYPAGDATLVSTTLGWRLVNPQMNPEWTVSLGEATELLRVREQVSREAQDAFALRSHQTAARAWDTGFYDNLVVEVPGVALERDESIRPDTSPEKLAVLKPVFRKDNGTVTAGNSSPLNDGASAVLLGSPAAEQLVGLPPLARIAGRGAAANDPRYFGFAPVEAANAALKRAWPGRLSRWERASEHPGHRHHPARAQQGRPRGPCRARHPARGLRQPRHRAPYPDQQPPDPGQRCHAPHGKRHARHGTRGTRGCGRP